MVLSFVLHLHEYKHKLYDSVAQMADQEQGQRTVVAAICVALIALLVTWFTRKTSAAGQKLQLPPGPKGWPILGALPLLSGLRHVALYKLSKKYGPLMYMHLGSLPTLVVSNAKMAKEVYKTNDLAMASRPRFTVISYIFYNNQDFAFVPSGSHWRKARKICTQELLTTSRISQFQDTRLHEVNRMVQSMWEEAQRGNTIDAVDFFLKLSMNIVTQMMWNKSHRTYLNSPSTDGTEEVFADLFREVAVLTGVGNIGDFIPSLNWLSMNLQGLNKRMVVVHKKLDKFIKEILEEHRQQALSLSRGTAEKVPSDADDFVDVLLDHTTRADADQHLSEDSVKAILTNMILAGTDTTGSTLEWALAEIIRHPHVMRRVQEELMLVVDSNRLAHEEDLPKLKYLTAVVKETLRLHPIGALAVPHASTADCKIDGYHIPANTLVFINLWAIQRDPEMWERPLEFQPERFLDQGAAAGIDYQGQSFHMLPFGAGRRKCPGVALATSVLHLSLAQMLHCMDWSLPGEQKPEDMDMTENIGFSCSKRVPLVLTAKARLSHDVMASVMVS